MSTLLKARLGVNIDHIATLRNQRGTPYPNLIRAADECIAGGARQITIHLREDRRHIKDQDLLDLRGHLKDIELNLEMACTDEMLHITLKARPHIVCLVPEKRQEKTTEGGLNLFKNPEMLEKIVRKTRESDIKVSLFIEPEEKDLVEAKRLGVHAVELHTGALCLAHQNKAWDSFDQHWIRFEKAITLGREMGLTINAGHGIDYEIAPKLAKVSGVYEYNIGHSIVCEAAFVGLKTATEKMKNLLNCR